MLQSSDFGKKEEKFKDGKENSQPWSPHRENTASCVDSNTESELLEALKKITALNNCKDVSVFDRKHKTWVSLKIPMGVNNLISYTSLTILANS